MILHWIVGLICLHLLIADWINAPTATSSNDLKGSAYNKIYIHILYIISYIILYAISDILYYILHIIYNIIYNKDSYYMQQYLYYRYIKRKLILKHDLIPILYKYICLYQIYFIIDIKWEIFLSIFTIASKTKCCNITHIKCYVIYIWSNTFCA